MGDDVLKKTHFLLKKEKCFFCFASLMVGVTQIDLLMNEEVHTTAGIESWWVDWIRGAEMV